MNRNELEVLVNKGLSIAKISDATGKSLTSVRHWLKKYELKTTGEAGSPVFSVACDGFKICKLCENNLPVESFRLRTDRVGKRSPYCLKCDSARVVKRQQSTKVISVTYKGNKCECCDGVFSASVYDFHHPAPEHKDFNISEKAGKLDLNKLKKELDKCILVCSNCHGLIHHEMKKREGYTNKIKGNTELWQNNKRRMHDLLGVHSCQKCGYDEYLGSLLMIFPDGTEKRNVTNWTPEYEAAIKASNVICKNCNRTT